MGFLQGRQKRRSGVTLAEALIMILVAGTLMVPVVGTLQQGVNRTASLEIRTAMQNFAESLMAKISYEGLHEGVQPSGYSTSLEFPNTTYPEYHFDAIVEVISNAELDGDVAAIDGTQHTDFCAVSVSVGLRDSGNDGVPDVATISLLTMVCPPPPPPDMIYCALPATQRIAMVNPMNHQLITEIPTTGRTPLHVAPHPNGRWLAIKCPGEIALLDLTSESVTTIYSAAGICGSNLAETGTGDNNTRYDRGLAFRSDGKYLYYTQHIPAELVVLKAPAGSIDSTWSPPAYNFTINSDQATDLKILDDGTLIVGQNAADNNRLFRLNTHTHEVISTFIAGADPANAPMQLALAGAWGGNKVFARMGNNRLTSFSPHSQTSFFSATVGLGGDINHHSMLTDYENQWLIMTSSDGPGANVEKILSFKLPLAADPLTSGVNETLSIPNVGSGNFPVSQIEYSPFRDELIVKTTDENKLLFPNIKAITENTYTGSLLAIAPAILDLGTGISDAKGRLAEYAWIACSDGVSNHKIANLDIYGGANSKGLILTDNEIVLANNNFGVGLNAGGNQGAIGIDAAGVPPMKLNVANQSAISFPNALDFPATARPGRSYFLLDGSLLVTTIDNVTTCNTGDFFPDGTTTYNDMVNGFLLYEPDDYGNPKSAPSLGFTADGATSGFVVSAVAPMNRTSGAYVAMSSNLGESLLLWIEKSTEMGYAPLDTTESYRIMGYWRTKHDDFPGRSIKGMALSADDTVLALYDTEGYGSEQIIRFYDLTNNRFPTTAGLAYARYDAGNPVGNTYFNSPIRDDAYGIADVKLKPKNAITAGSTLNSDANYDDQTLLNVWDVANSTEITYSLFGYFYHEANTDFIGFKSKDAVRLGWKGYYPSHDLLLPPMAAIREPWADSSGTDYGFAYRFNPVIESDQINIDYYSDNSTQGSLFTHTDTAANLLTDINEPRAQDFRPFKFKPPLLKELLLNDTEVLATGDVLPSGLNKDVIMCFTRDAAIPNLFFIDRVNKKFYTYNVFTEIIKLNVGTLEDFEIDLSPLGFTAFNDMVISPDGRRLLIAAEGGSNAILSFAIDYIAGATPPWPGQIAATANDHTIFDAIALDLPPKRIAVRPFASFSSKSNKFINTPTTGAALASGYGAHRAAVADGGIYLFGGAPGIEAEANSDKISKIDAKFNTSDEPTVLNEYLKEFTAVPFDDNKILLFGGEAPGDEFRSSVSVYDTKEQKFHAGYYDDIRSKNNSEKIRLRKHAAAATPYGPIIMGGVEGDLTSGGETIPIDSSWSTSSYQYNNSAGGVINVGSGFIKLGRNTTGSSNTVFYKTPFEISANTSFISSFTTEMCGKDGLTFCVQNAPSGVNAFGSSNSGLGYDGITQSLAVWIDTKGGNDGFNVPSGWADSDNFVAITTSGNKPPGDPINSSPATNEWHTVYPSHGLGGDDSILKTVHWWVYYDGVRDRINVWSNTTNDSESAVWAVKDCGPLALDTIVGGAGSTAYFGFTGASNEDEETWSEIKVKDWSLKVWEKEPQTTECTGNFSSNTNIDADFQRHDNAEEGSGRLELTPGSSSCRGAAWYKTAIDLDTLDSFTARYSVLSSGDDDGSDGVAFVIQGAGTGLSPTTSSGMAGYNTSNSVAVIMKTYNSNSDERINLHKSSSSPTRSYTNPPDLNFGTNHNWFWVEFDKPSRNLRVFFTQSGSETTPPTKPTNPLFNHIFNLPLSSIIGTNMATIGFTSRTPSSSPPQINAVSTFRFDKANLTATIGGMTDKVRAFYPNAISGHLPAVSGLFAPALGNASLEDNHLLITPNTSSVVGAVWLNNSIPIFPDTSFSAEFLVNIDGTGSGITFAVNGNSNLEIGVDNYGIGYDTISANSFALELDTFLSNATYDPSNSHLSIVKDGDSRAPLVTKNLLPGITLGDGTDKWVWVDYNGISDEIKVYISLTSVKPASPEFTHPLGDLTTILGTQAYFGFTGSTGSSGSELGKILGWHLEVDGETIIRFPQQGETLEVETLSAPMMHGAAVTHYSRKEKKFYLYYIGPSSALAAEFPAMVYRYDFDAGTWSTIELFSGTDRRNIKFSFSPDDSGNATNQRNQIAACSWGDEIFIFGGVYSSTNSVKCLAFNPDTNTYRELENLATDRNIAAAIPYGPFIYLIGGSSASTGTGGALNSMLRYKP